MSKLKKLEKKNKPEDYKLEDLLVDPDYLKKHPVPKEVIEEHDREFTRVLGVDIKEFIK
ncbi:MAG: hypothetical protein JJE53_03725 [Candidatus Pacebacteria bacterium]|nr:hypothetical protein [Candidatus Paceibacterota bacterium]